jgi:YYY domain-containing protein
LALPFVLGAIGVINTWDLPTYLGVIVATFLLSQYRRAAGQLNFGKGLLLLLRGGVFAVGLAIVTYLLYAPFFLNYQAPAETGLGLVRNQTPLDQHLKIWGFFLFIIVFWLGLSLLHPASRNSLLRLVSLALCRWNVWPHFSRIYQKIVTSPSGPYQLVLWTLGLTGVFTVFLLFLGYTVPAYLLPLTLVALLLLFRREVRVETAYLGLLAFTGLFILLGLEFFFLNDFLGGDIYYRMNTLFKFFIQVWVMFGVMAAVAFGQLWQWVQRWPFRRQVVWQMAAMLLLLGTFIYPIFATQTRLDDRFPGDHNRPASGTLDGLAYMTVGTFEWPAGTLIELRYDYEAIRWLQNNVEGTPIIAEAKIGYYREGGMRVAAYTGLPSILGGLHQNEQHPAWQIGDRDFVVNEFWSTSDPARTLELIDTLNISYIYIGQVERITYGPQIDDKFEQLRQQGELEVVFENEKTKIYERKDNSN